METSWYAVTASGILPMRTEIRIQGSCMRVGDGPGRQLPRGNFFANLGPGHYRLMYKADQSAMILVARSRGIGEDGSGSLSECHRSAAPWA